MKNEQIADIARMFKVLSDETRLQIIDLLSSRNELCVQDISQDLKLPIANVSHHLQQLKREDIVKESKEGKQVYYSLCQDSIKEVIECCTSFIKRKANKD